LEPEITSRDDGLVLRRKRLVRRWVVKVLDSEAWNGESRKLFSRVVEDGRRICWDAGT